MLKKYKNGSTILFYKRFLNIMKTTVLWLGCSLPFVGDFLACCVARVLAWFFPASSWCSNGKRDYQTPAKGYFNKRGGRVLPFCMMKRMFALRDRKHVRQVAWDWLYALKDFPKFVFSELWWSMCLALIYKLRISKIRANVVHTFFPNMDYHGAICFKGWTLVFQ